MEELEGRVPRAPRAAQARERSPCCTDPAPVGRLWDSCGIANMEPVFKKEEKEVQLAGPQSS